jgi:hypothetical protein
MQGWWRVKRMGVNGFSIFLWPHGMSRTKSSTGQCKQGFLPLLKQQNQTGISASE